MSFSPEWRSDRTRGARRYPFSARRRTRAPSRSTPWTRPRPPLRAHGKGRGEIRHREPLHRDKQRDQTMKPRAYPARSGGGGGGRRRRRRGGARRRRSRHSGPCRTSARARCSPPPRPRPPPSLSLLSPFPASASTRRDPRGNPCIAGAEGGRPRLPNPGVREIPRTDRPRGLSPRRAAPVAPPGLAGSFGWQLGASNWLGSRWWRELLLCRLRLASA